jgi:hypothetical protein
MSWLRIDDQMPLNGKVGRLTDTEYRALVALWAYCSRRKTERNRRQSEGFFDPIEVRFAIYATPTGPKSVTNRQLKRFLDLGLVQVQGEGFVVHNWRKYQPKDPTSAERMRRFRAHKES